MSCISGATTSPFNDLGVDTRRCLIGDSIFPALDILFLRTLTKVCCITESARRSSAEESFIRELMIGLLFLKSPPFSTSFIRIVGSLDSMLLSRLLNLESSILSAMINTYLEIYVGSTGSGTDTRSMVRYLNWIAAEI